MKKLKKIIVGLLCFTLLFSLSVPIISNASDNDLYEIIVDENGYFTVNGEKNIYSDQSRVSEIGDFLSNYFYTDSNGNVKLDITVDEIASKLNLSTEETNQLYEFSKDLPNIYNRGFVGLTLRLGPKVRSMGSVLAGGFAAGYCGWYLKEFAKTPVTAGVVGAISAGIGGAVAWAVNKGLTSVDVGVDVPGISKRFYVNVP